MNLDIAIEEESLQYLKKRKQVLEPQNKFEFCQAFSKITNRPLGLFLKETKHWPLDWFFSIQSECKEKTREKQAIYINWFIKESRPK